MKSKRGALAIEYAVLIAIVVAALIGMSAYIKRALSGKWRQAGDAFGYGRQYEPKITKGGDSVIPVVTEVK